MKLAMLILLLSTWHIGIGQGKTIKHIVSPVTIDKHFKDTLTFHKKWDYPWYIVVDDDGGNMENTLGGSLTGPDTIHMYHTANCYTNHQGRHHVRYCDAILNNDTISLFFQPELPAYASKLSVSIKDNFFWSDFSAVYPAPTGKLSWVITKQKLVLDRPSYRSGDTIKGYLEIEFVEIDSGSNQKADPRKYYYKGYFKNLLIKE